MPEKLLDILDFAIESAKKHGADAADAIVFDTEELSVSQRMGKVENIEHSHSGKFGLRVLFANKDGYSQTIVSSSDSSQKAIDEAAEKACQMAKIATIDKHTKLISSGDLIKNVPNLDLADGAELKVADLTKLANEAEQAALKVEGINNSEGADAGFSKSTIAFATSEGFSNQYKTTMFSNSVSVVAGVGTNKETDYDYTMARFANDLQDAETIGRLAGENTVKKLNPRQAKSCKAPVIFDKRQAKSLVSAFASAINGTAVAKGVTFLSDKLGQQIFNENINIFDDPLIKRGLSSRPFDAEGVATEKLQLIENGKLCGWLLDSHSASKLDLKTTGNAARGISTLPQPSPSNLYMQNGNVSKEDLIADIKEGLYVTDIFGMGVNGVTGDYSQGAGGFWIENGEIAYAVSEITIAGNLLDMFKNITAANDLEMKYSTNCPTLRIDGMTIAGE